MLLSGMLVLMMAIYLEKTVNLILVSIIVEMFCGKELTRISQSKISWGKLSWMIALTLLCLMAHTKLYRK